jgi:hypothetical protein
VASPTSLPQTERSMGHAPMPVAISATNQQNGQGLYVSVVIFGGARQTAP